MKLRYVVAFLAAIAAIAGLLDHTLYRDAPILREGFLANDIVTVLVAIPILVAHRSPLVRLGALHYFFYTYCFYLFGAVLNPLLLVYAGIVTTAAWSIVLVLRDLTLPNVERHRGVAAWLAFVSLGLATTWTAQWLVALLRTTPPTRFDLAPDFVRTTAALDLTLMVGLMIPAAILLWRGKPLGIALGAMTSVSGALYNVVLMAGTVAQIHTGMTGATLMMGLWAFLFAGCTIAAKRLTMTSGLERASTDELPQERGLRDVLRIDWHETIDQKP